MSVQLSAEQVASVKDSSSARYGKDVWVKYVSDAAAGKASVGRCEDDFPGVKPAHVRHMFRLVLKDDAELAKKLTVAKSDEFGIVLKYIGK